MGKPSYEDKREDDEKRAEDSQATDAEEGNEEMENQSPEVEDNAMEEILANKMKESLMLAEATSESIPDTDDGSEEKYQSVRRGRQTRGLQVSQAPTISEGRKAEPRTGLRPIVIDGSNVAMAHGKNKEFSAKGIKIVADHSSRLATAKLWLLCLNSGRRW